MESPAVIVSDLKRALEQWRILEIGTPVLAEEVALAGRRLARFVIDDREYLANLSEDD